MSEPTPSTAPLPRAAHLRCIECGYDLVGLAETAQCPECGCPIADTLRGRAAPFRSAEQVRRLIRGSRLAMIGAGMMTMIAIAAFAVPVLGGVSLSLGPRDVLVVGIVPMALACGAWMRGVYLCTRPDEAPRGLPIDLRTHRLSVIAMFIHSASLLALVAYSAGSQEPLANGGPFTMLAVLGMVLFWLSCALLGTTHISAIIRQAARARNERYERIARDLRPLFVSTVAIGAACFWVAPVIGFTFYCMLLYIHRLRLMELERTMRRVSQNETHPD